MQHNDMQSGVHTGQSSRRPQLATRGRIASSCGAVVARLARCCGFADAQLHGRVALSFEPGLLSDLSSTRTVVLVCQDGGDHGGIATAALLGDALTTRAVVTGDALRGHSLAALTTGLATSAAPIVVGAVGLHALAAGITQTRPLAVVLATLSPSLEQDLARGAAVEALRAAGQGPLQPWVVANVDDPAVVAIAAAFGKVVWVAAGRPRPEQHRAAPRCPCCAVVLRCPDGRWYCPGCGLSRPEPTWRLGSGELLDHRGVSLGVAVLTPRAELVALRVDPRDRGTCGNATLAVAAAALVGVPAEKAAHAIAAPGTPDGTR